MGGGKGLNRTAIKKTFFLRLPLFTLYLEAITSLGVLVASDWLLMTSVGARLRSGRSGRLLLSSLTTEDRFIEVKQVYMSP